MSKLTLDEAIKHCNEVAENNEQFASGKWIGSEGEANRQECEQCAADHRQLAEWLTELKELREENINLKNDNERLRDCVDSCVYNGELDYAELAEAKRLLKAAVEDFSEIKSYLSEPYSHLCDKWRYADEALKLIQNS